MDEYKDYFKAMFQHELHFRMKMGQAAIAALVLIALIILRERSWRADSNAKSLLIESLSTSVSDLTRLESADRLALELMWNMTASCPNVTFPDVYNSTVIKDESSIIQKIYDPVLLDKKGITLAALMLLLLVMEVFYFHDFLLKALEEDTTCISRKCFSNCKLAITRGLPICNLIIFSIVLMFSPLAWLGLFDRFSFIMFFMKVLLIWSWVLPLGYIITNLIRIRQYLPSLSDRKEWLRALKDLSWWIWLAKSLLCLDTLSNFLVAYGVVFILWIAAWPMSYFFYNSTSHQLLFNNIYTTHIYIINMMFHLSLSIVFWCFSLLDITRSPDFIKKLFKRLDSPEVSKSNSKLGLLLGGLSIILLCSIALAVIRVGWFMFISRTCNSYYCIFIMSFYITPIVLVPLLTINLVQTNLEKDGIDKSLKKEFKSKYIEIVNSSVDMNSNNESSNSDNNSNSDNSNDNSNDSSNNKPSLELSKELENEFEEFWSQILIVSAIVSIFDEQMKEYAVKKVAADKEERNKKKKARELSGLGSGVNDNDNNNVDNDDENDDSSSKNTTLFVIITEVLYKLSEDNSNANANANKEEVKEVNEVKEEINRSSGPLPGTDSSYDNLNDMYKLD